KSSLLQLGGEAFYRLEALFRPGRNFYWRTGFPGREAFFRAGQALYQPGRLFTGRCRPLADSTGFLPAGAGRAAGIKPVTAGKNSSGGEGCDGWFTTVGGLY